MFDKVILGIGVNVDKKELQLAIYELPDIIKRSHEVLKYDGFLVDVVRKMDVTIIRGLRNGKDLDDEKVLRCRIKEFGDKPVLYFICDSKYEYVSSSYIRGLSYNMQSKYAMHHHNKREFRNDK